MRYPNPTFLAAMLLPLNAAAANPEATACVAAYEKTQERRAAGDLIEARASAIECSAEACQPFLRKECSTWRAELQAAIPTIRIDLEGLDSALEAGVELEVDGRVVSTADSLLVSLNPGRHEIVARSGRRLASTEVHLVAGDKARPVTVTFPTAAEPTPAMASTQRHTNEADSPTPPPPATPQAPKSRAIPIALGVVGVAGLVGFGVVRTVARSKHEQLPRCFPECPAERVSEVNNLYLASDISLGVGVTTLVLATGILIFTRDELPARATTSRKKVRLAFEPELGGLRASLGGQF